MSPDDRRRRSRGLGEFGLIARVDRGPRPAREHAARARATTPPSSPRRTGAWWPRTDVLVEGVHFRLDWSTPEQVGRKAAAANLADVAAMGAVPTALLVGLACPADTPVATSPGWPTGCGPRRRAVGRGRRRRRRRASADARARRDRARVARGPGAGHPRRARGRATSSRCAGGSAGPRPGSRCCSAASGRPVRWSAAHRVPEPPYAAGPGGRARRAPRR